METPHYVHGRTQKGHERYRYGKCKKTHISEEPKYTEEFKRKAIQLYLEGNSGRAVGRMKKIGKNTIGNGCVSMMQICLKLKNKTLKLPSKMSFTHI